MGSSEILKLLKALLPRKNLKSLSSKSGKGYTESSGGAS
jgi:hypothetical protein